MKNNGYPVWALIVILAANLSAVPAFGEGREREAVWAGKFYPATAAELRRAIEGYSEEAGKSTVKTPSQERLKALVIPHAGYIYSGLTAAHAARVIDSSRFSRVVLMGPDHRIGFSNCAVSDVAAYRTPLGAVPLHPSAAKLRSESALFRSVPQSDRLEHSLEVVLPFLQVRLEEFSLVPIVIGGLCDLPAITAAVEPMIDRETLLVVSSDLSHFLPYEQARKKDEQTIRLILNLKETDLLGGSNTACGVKPLAILIRLAKKHGWKPALLSYTNSGDTAGDRSRVVGYAAIAFYGDTK